MYRSLTARISIALPQEYAMQYHKYVFLGGYTEMAKKYQQIGIVKASAYFALLMVKHLTI